MGEVMGFGISHYPPFALTDTYMSGLLKRASPWRADTD
jgi:hypothetical protein